MHEVSEEVFAGVCYAGSVSRTINSVEDCCLACYADTPYCTGFSYGVSHCLALNRYIRAVADMWMILQNVDNLNQDPDGGITLDSPANVDTCRVVYAGFSECDVCGTFDSTQSSVSGERNLFVSRSLSN